MDSKKQQMIKKETLIKVGIAFLFPFVLCFVYCLIHKESLFHLYVPASYNNDSLYYFKTVEGILSYAYPRGYFGYNEGHAILGSLGYWPPINYLPWVIWGRVFGINNGSLLFCNLFMFSTAFSGFVLLSKPKWEQFIFSLLFLSVFPAVPDHLLSVLPETFIVSLMLVLFGLMMGENGFEEKKAIRNCLIGMFLCVFLLTMARPYYGMFAVIPYLFMKKRKVKKAELIAVSFCAGALGIYLLTEKLFTAPYFSSMPFISMLQDLLQGDTSAFVRRFTRAMNAYGVWFKSLMADTFLKGYLPGVQFLTALICFVLVTVQGFLEEKENRKWFFIFTGAMVIVLFLLVIMMQKVYEGGRHLFVFSVIGCLLLAYGKPGMKSTVLKTLLISFLLICVLRGSFFGADYEAPFKEEKIVAGNEYWAKRFESVRVDKKAAVGYENTIDWIIGDSSVLSYNELYAIPKGMGLNCCEMLYAKEHIDDLFAKYIAVCPDGNMEILCKERGYEELGRTTGMVIYKRY